MIEAQTRVAHVTCKAKLGSPVLSKHVVIRRLVLRLITLEGKGSLSVRFPTSFLLGFQQDNTKKCTCTSGTHKLKCFQIQRRGSHPHVSQILPHSSFHVFELTHAWSWLEGDLCHHPSMLQLNQDMPPSPHFIHQLQTSAAGCFPSG